MAYLNSKETRTPTALEQLLEEINFQRTKEMRQILKDGNEDTENNFKDKKNNQYFQKVVLLCFMEQLIGRICL